LALKNKLRRFAPVHAKLFAPEAKLRLPIAAVDL